LKNCLDNNDCILVHEDGHWNLKGHFTIAIEDNEDLEWSLENGKYCAHLMIVIIIIFLLKFSIFIVLLF
jgi:hypothetical protein